MARNPLPVFLVLGVLLFASATTGQEVPEILMMIEARVPVEPAPVLAKDAHHLLYEVVFTNHLPMTVTLVRFEARGDDEVLISYEGAELADNIALVGNRSAEADERSTIPAGGSAMTMSYRLLRLS